MADGPRYKLPEGIYTPEEIAEMFDGRCYPPEATEEHLRWLESGADGPDPLLKYEPV